MRQTNRERQVPCHEQWTRGLGIVINRTKMFVIGDNQVILLFSLNELNVTIFIFKLRLLGLVFEEVLF